MLYNNRRIKIKPKLRKYLTTYKLNYPTDARTKEYKAQIERFKAPELYKLFLQTKVEQAKLKQKETNKQERKVASKKARAEKKATKKKDLKRYIGSMFLKVKILKKQSKNKPNEPQYITKTLIIDIKVDKEELNDALMDIQNEYIDNILGESGIIFADVVSRKDSIQMVNDKIKPLTKVILYNNIKHHLPYHTL